MKKVMVGVVMMVLLSVAAQAQNDVIAKFFNKYDGDESFSKVSISGKMFSMMANIDGNTEDEKAMISAISKIKGLKILKKDDARNSRELYKEALSMVPAGQFEELMIVRDKDKDMKFFTKESGGKISELVMVLGGNEEFLVMSLFGEIDLKEMGKIGKSVNIDGLQNLDKMKDKVKDKKKD
ncbi:MAG: DUF4252 domain-containing protein [Cytophagales bacterium]|jgi:hypothetical protein|nr:DUF4252 domain-containing protein [Cytophagales bacterium]MCA6387467.1 DUF4252 domain-containing protein [Cytophagales bacterium]MCA6393127.1 DUF4252 domain-containing protein [Cytophagales bacterium]MCA6396481.1 DUF4252 domain-containing protein [Cytophagales bacterium]MCA6397361.1 DUF4252 domain-containing protein [Cytophagales bacterium]